MSYLPHFLKTLSIFSFIIFDSPDHFDDGSQKLTILLHFAKFIILYMQSES